MYSFDRDRIRLAAVSEDSHAFVTDKRELLFTNPDCKSWQRPIRLYDKIHSMLFAGNALYIAGDDFIRICQYQDGHWTLGEKEFFSCLSKSQPILLLGVDEGHLILACGNKVLFENRSVAGPYPRYISRLQGAILQGKCFFAWNKLVVVYRNRWTQSLEVMQLFFNEDGFYNKVQTVIGQLPLDYRILDISSCEIAFKGNPIKFFRLPISSVKHLDKKIVIKPNFPVPGGYVSEEEGEEYALGEWCEDYDDTLNSDCDSGEEREKHTTTAGMYITDSEFVYLFNGCDGSQIIGRTSQYMGRWEVHDACIRVPIHPLEHGLISRPMTDGSHLILVVDDLYVYQSVVDCFYADKMDEDRSFLTEAMAEVPSCVLMIGWKDLKEGGNSITERVLEEINHGIAIRNITPCWIDEEEL